MSARAARRAAGSSAGVVAAAAASRGAPARGMASLLPTRAPGPEERGPEQRGPVERAIRAKLEAGLAPVSHLDVVNESHMHSVPRGSESHFKVVAVSPAFQGMGLLERHRRVNALLADEFRAGLHALSIVAKTPQQWAQSSAVSASPNCLGGSKHDRDRDRDRDRGGAAA